MRFGCNLSVFRCCSSCGGCCCIGKEVPLILENFGVVAAVQGNTYHFFSILQYGFTQEKIAVPQEDRLSAL